MEKAQWSPINSEPTSAAFSPAAKAQNPSLTRLPINFSNGTPVRAKKHHTGSPKHIPDRLQAANNLTLSGDLSASRLQSRSSKPREVDSAGILTINQTHPYTPSTTISPDEHAAERHVESNRHEMATDARNPTSMPNSRAATQTPKADHQAGVAVMTNRIQQQKPSQIQTTKELYQAFGIPPSGEDNRVISEEPSNATKMNEPRQSPTQKTPRPRDSPASFTKDSPNEYPTKSREGHTKPVQDHRPIEIDEPSSSSSDDDAADQTAHARRTAEDALEEAEGSVMDEPGHVTTANSLPDDHPIEWLAEAKEIYRNSVPPFAIKQKVGVRRMVELPLAEGQQDAEKIEVVYRLWDAMYTFASIDRNGQRFIVKAFRGGATPYRPWLGPRTGFSETALAFAKQVPRGPKSWATTQGKGLSLPKGWALREEDEKDDDYSPGNRRKSVQVRGRRNPNYNDQEEFDEDAYQEDPYQIAEPLHSERSSMERDDAVSDPTGGGRRDSNISTKRPPSKLINAVKKSLRLPKEQDDFPQPKQIKRRSIGGQGATTDSGGNKHQKHKVDFSSDSEISVPHKRTKATKAIPHRSPHNAPHRFSPLPTAICHTKTTFLHDHSYVLQHRDRSVWLQRGQRPHLRYFGHVRLQVKRRRG